MPWTAADAAAVQAAPEAARERVFRERAFRDLQHLLRTTAPEREAQREAALAALPAAPASGSIGVGGP